MQPWVVDVEVSGKTRRVDANDEQQLAQLATAVYNEQRAIGNLISYREARAKAEDRVVDAERKRRAAATLNPTVIAAKAREFCDSAKKQGFDVSISDAVRHVMGPTAHFRELAMDINHTVLSLHAIQFCIDTGSSFRDAYVLITSRSFSEADVPELPDDNEQRAVLDEILGPLPVSWIKYGVWGAECERQLQIHKGALRVSALEGNAYKDAVLSVVRNETKKPSKGEKE